MHYAILWSLYATIICGLIVLFMVFNRCRENFSNSENRKIYNIFSSTQKNNKTFSDFKEQLSKNQINFTGSGDANFEQYANMLRKYNKNSLNVDDIDNIRNG